MKNALLEDGSQIMANALSFFKAQDEKAQKNWEKTGAPYLKGSISKYTRDLIMTFPTLCDTSLPADVASMISRANERNIVTMLQLLFSAEQMNGRSGSEVLSLIHKNINVSMDMDDVIDSIDNFIAQNESTKFPTVTDADLTRVVREMTQELSKPVHSFPVESLNERSLNDYTVFNNNGRIIVREDKASDDAYDKIIKQQQVGKNAQDFYLNQMKARKTGLEIQDLEDRIQRNKDQANTDDEERRELAKDREYKRFAMGQQAQQFNADMISKRLLDTDIKKANEMAPTLMIVQFNELDNDNTIYNKRSFVAGVKSRLIPVDSVDIMERLIVKNKTKINFLNFVRATTGEIKFFSDFLLCIKQAKIDAKNSVKKGPAAKMWKVLENRSSKNVFNSLKKRKNDASAITTLVINQETVNIMKKQYDFDLEVPKNAKMILEAYNLLGIVICDESIQVAKFLYAGNDMFEQQAYSYLEKESNDKSYKNVINLLAKAGR